MDINPLWEALRNTPWLLSVYVFVLAIFIGFEIITKVPPTLHTPLMSGANAISGITIVGAILQLEKGDVTFGEGPNASTTVTLTSNITAKNVRFDHDVTYRLSGGSVRLQADVDAPLLSVLQGRHLDGQSVCRSYRRRRGGGATGYARSALRRREAMASA